MGISARKRMNLRHSAVLLARVLAFIEYADLVSGIKTSGPDIMRKLVARYKFEKYPQTLEEMDLGKGIEFQAGQSVNHGPILKFVVWDTLLVLETRTNTSTSKSIIEEILEWSAQECGINYSAGAIKRFAFISDVTFFTDVPILNVSPAVNALASRCSTELSKIWQESVKYEPFTVRVGHDPTARKYGIAPFSIEHRGETRFSENKYFSEAPLPTDKHWELLEQFEKDMKGGKI